MFFIECKMSDICVINCASNAGRMCQTFIDLKETFGRVNKAMMSEELMSRGVK